MQLTPYILRILLDVYVGGEIREDQNAPIYPDTLKQLIEHKYIEPLDFRVSGYAPTDKLRFLMEKILALPEPTCKWSMPT